MLVLTRRRGETVIFRQRGKVIARIILAEITRNRVRLAIEGESLEVNRSEVDMDRHPGDYEDGPLPNVGRKGA